jgi:hypothetical protein
MQTILIKDKVCLRIINVLYGVDKIFIWFLRIV